MTRPNKRDIEKRIADLEEADDEEELDLGDLWRQALGKDPNAGADADTEDGDDA